MTTVDFAVLKGTTGLVLPESMSDQAWMDYCHELDQFIETLPNKTYELTKIFIGRDFVALKKKIAELFVVLKRIHAEGAAADCWSAVQVVESGNKTAIDIYLEKFIARLTTLSIDIQLAQYKSGEKKKKSASEEELTVQPDVVLLDAAPPEANGSEVISELKASPAANILVVDDDAVILNTVKQVLESAAYKFIGASSGKAALKYLGAHRSPNLCILDIEMPRMDGYELAEQIFANGHDMPVIFLTSNATRENVQKALRVGASDFLVKPAGEELILDKLRHYIG